MVLLAYAAAEVEGVDKRLNEADDLVDHGAAPCVVWCSWVGLGWGVTVAGVDVRHTALARR